MYKSYIRNAKKRTARGEKNRETVAPDNDQQYAVVRVMLGNGRLKAYCENGVEVIARIRGSMRKYKSKVIIAPGDLIILSMRDYEDDKADVVHKYNHEEVTELMYRSCLPDKIMKALTENELGYAPQTDDYVMFTNATQKDIEMAEEEQQRLRQQKEGAGGGHDGNDSDLDIGAI